MRHTVFPCVLLAAALLAGCGAADDAPRFAPPPTGKTTADSGAISTPRPAAAVLPTPQDVLRGTHWPAASVGSGEASISCDTDYATGDGRPLLNLEYFSVLDAMDPCRDKGASPSRSMLTRLKQSLTPV